MKTMLFFLSLLWPCALLGTGNSGGTQLQRKETGRAGHLARRRLSSLLFEERCAQSYVFAEQNRVFVLAEGASQGMRKARWRVAVMEVKEDAFVERGRTEVVTAEGVAVAHMPGGVAFAGGASPDGTAARCFSLLWDHESGRFTHHQLPSLPSGCAFASAVFFKEVLYLVGGCEGGDASRPKRTVLQLTLSATPSHWKVVATLPGEGRLRPAVSVQHDGFSPCLYVLGGTSKAGKPCLEAWRLDLTGVRRGKKARTWLRCASPPLPLRYGCTVPFGQSHLLAVDQKGREVVLYHTITDRWVVAGELPVRLTADSVSRGFFHTQAILSTVARKKGGSEVNLHAVQWVSEGRSFGVVNTATLVLYLLCVLVLGLSCARGTGNTDQYFRGGKRLPFWAAGCSIFATLLSSITYLAIPAKAFAQDWVYFPGNLMILVVAPVAVFVALPYFRRIDATSAYEYLEQRFSRPLRLFGAGSFCLFHLFRMAIVMSLASLALASVVPLSPRLCVLVMGLASVLYSTFGGVSAVVWTDTLQTFVLFGGAVACFATLVAAVPGGFPALYSEAFSAGKLTLANCHFDPSSAALALWVVVIGGIGQQLPPYTADQGVVQRYMTTADRKRAARSIWLAAFLSFPASVLFFGLGTALFVFYRVQPERLDPSFMTDQILPLYIAGELPAPLGGIIVAGIFAAAQSTISTSMNASSSVAVTDFLRPLCSGASESWYLRAGRLGTAFFGGAGTVLGILFVNPDIRSLWDSFILILGLFMGVLGGAFLLGMLNKRATAGGAAFGCAAGVAAMIFLASSTPVVSYLYAAAGIVVCLVSGSAASMLGKASRTAYAGKEPKR